METNVPEYEWTVLTRSPTKLTFLSWSKTKIVHIWVGDHPCKLTCSTCKCNDVWYSLYLILTPDNMTTIRTPPDHDWQPQHHPINMIPVGAGRASPCVICTHWCHHRIWLKPCFGSDNDKDDIPDELSLITVVIFSISIPVCFSFTLLSNVIFSSWYLIGSNSTRTHPFLLETTMSPVQASMLPLIPLHGFKSPTRSVSLTEKLATYPSEIWNW